MKLSIAWIFEHIKASPEGLDINWLADKLNSTIAEVDSIRKVKINLENLFLFEVKSIPQIGSQLENSEILGYCQETGKKINLELTDYHKALLVNSSLESGLKVGQYYLIIRDNKNYRWATLKDIGSSEREEYLGQVWVPQDQLNGSWKNNIPTDDIVIDIDNKSITHRPDLWCHRGFAREIAVLLKSELLPEDDFLASKPIKHYDTKSLAIPNNPFILSISLENLNSSNLDLSNLTKLQNTNNLNTNNSNSNLDLNISLKTNSSFSDNNNTNIPNIFGPCRRLAGAYIKSIENRGSILPVAIKLAKVDAKPINAIVDLTNYVMFDFGQPMHAFDADKLDKPNIKAGFAKAGQVIDLLDGQELKLTDQDCIISDESGPISLAGIMGGSKSAVSSSTNKLLLESGNFDPIIIRRTCNRIKKRTEAAIRFQKGLDPNQNTQALLRYLRLLSDNSIAFESSEYIISIGALSSEKIIQVEQSFISKKLGLNVTADQIENILLSLGFGVQAKQISASSNQENFNNNSAKSNSQSNLSSGLIKSNFGKSNSGKTNSGFSLSQNDTESGFSYIDNSGFSNNVLFTVTVPTFRVKDVNIPEDIVEEVGRFVGYNNITPKPCIRAMVPFDTHVIFRKRAIKQQFAFGLKMHEVENYAFCDEEFLKKIDFDPSDALAVANPLNSNNKRLVTSLVPNLLKNIAENMHKQSTLRFFEYNRIWFTKLLPNKDETQVAIQPIEVKEIAGIFYNKDKALDFYTIKAELSSFFELLSLKIDWVNYIPVLKTPWYGLEAADLYYGEQRIGRAGIVSNSWLNKFLIGHAFVFELDGDFIEQHNIQIPEFKPLPKYQGTTLDISSILPLNVTYDKISKLIKASSPLITDVKLVDIYHKKEWQSKRSLAIRLYLYNSQGNLTSKEISDVKEHAEKILSEHGAEIR